MTSPAASFEEVAWQYATARPGYPDDLFDFTVETCGLQYTSRLLEVGCGTGQATKGFASRGFEIVGLEPGAMLAAEARRCLSAFPGVSVEESTFESWDPRGRHFDMLFSAQAFHWIDPMVALAKPLSVLKRDGWLVWFWNIPLRTASPLRSAMDHAYRKHAPQLAAAPVGASVRAARDVIGRFEAERSYRRVAQKTTPWGRPYTAQAYVQLLGTYSDHLALTQASRQALLRELAAVIEGHGGVIEMHYEAKCFVFRVASS